LGAVPLLLLAISASTTGAHSSLDVSQGLNPQPWLLKALVYHSATPAAIALGYDEDTMSLVVDPTLSTLDISISDNSDSFTGNASAFEYECYEVKDDTPRFNYHGPKITIPKQEPPMTICTADTIGTIRSQRLFRVLFDSETNVSMIKRLALPKGVITKLLGDTKLVRTLAQDVLGRKKSSRCKTSDCQSSIRAGVSTNKRY
jgi:hypothetical protein